MGFSVVISTRVRTPRQGVDPGIGLGGIPRRGRVQGDRQYFVPETADRTAADCEPLLPRATGHGKRARHPIWPPVAIHLVQPTSRREK
jgi:hypothetical protein